MTDMNPAALDEILDLLGEAKTRELLGVLADDLGKRFASEKAEVIAFDAHATISSAGTFGFVSLASVCRTVENACRAGADVTPLLVRLNDERARALDQIAALRMAA